MNKIEYFLYCCERRAYQRKKWIIAAFSLIVNTPANIEKMKETPLVLLSDDNGWYFYNEEGVKVSVEGDVNKPLLDKNDKFICDNEIFKGETTVGIYLLNMVIFYEPFKNKVKYHNGLIGGSTVKKVISDLMSDPDEDGNIPEGKASVSDCLKLSAQANYLIGCINVFSKPAGTDLLTVDKEVIAFRDKLLRENKDKLNDPETAARIVAEVVAFDTEKMLAGESKEFFISDKFLNVARKKMFLIFGFETDWVTGEYKLISRPLADGWDLKNMSVYINTAISGSYLRGKATGEGGARVKDIIRLTSRIIINKEDCGTTKYENVKIYPDTLNKWIGSFYFEGDKCLRFDGNRDAIGKVLKMRVPNFCKCPDRNYCFYCCGEKFGSSELSASSEAQDIPTSFMLLKMKETHVSGGISVVDIPLEEMFAA